MARNLAMLLTAIFMLLLFSSDSMCAGANTGRESKRTGQFKEKAGEILKFLPPMTGKHTKQRHALSPQILLWHFTQLEGKFWLSLVLNQTNDPFSTFRKTLSTGGQEGSKNSDNPFLHICDSMILQGSKSTGIFELRSAQLASEEV